MNNNADSTEATVQEKKSDDRSVGEKISDYWNQVTDYARTHDLGSDYLNILSGYYGDNVDQRFNQIMNEIAIKHPELTEEQARQIAFADAMVKFGYNELAMNLYGDSPTGISSLDTAYTSIVSKAIDPLSGSVADQFTNAYINHEVGKIPVENSFTYTPPDLNFMPAEDPFRSVLHPFDQSMNTWNESVLPGEIITAESPDFHDPGFDVTATINSVSTIDNTSDHIDNSWMDSDSGTF